MYPSRTFWTHSPGLNLPQLIAIEASDTMTAQLNFFIFVAEINGPIANARQQHPQEEPVRWSSDLPE
jgi:hypothetical protein